MVTRRRFIQWFGAALAGAPHLGVLAQAYPAKPIRIVVPYPPGGTADVLARILGQRITEHLGQTVIVDNRGGAGGNIGTELVVKAAPDGYTLVLGTVATHGINAYGSRKLPYDPVTDFAPIAALAQNIICVAANPSLPVHSIRELVNYAKQNPGKISFASSSTGTPHHLAGELKKKPHIKTGKLRILAVVEGTRSPSMPEVPTVGETVSGFEISSWLGLFAPAGTPPAIIRTLNAEAVRTLSSPDTRASLDAQGLNIVVNSPEQFAEQVKLDYERWGKLIKSIGVQL
ncbi:MAG: tripartite tricarboxylate transporter substrate-binding protein, partial [Proteobacteria bacterium]|nr:tripartite tricarboxylate transporter substrate-binding protein [Pseudomonadota bacterium]